MIIRNPLEQYINDKPEKLKRHIFVEELGVTYLNTAGESREQMLVGVNSG